MNYICKFGLVHDKPCPTLEPSSNNGFIYSAIGTIVGLVLNRGKIENTFTACAEIVDYGNILINRLPGKKEPPLSHDEALGLYLLDLVDYETFKDNHFVFRGQGKPLNTMVILTALKGVLKLILIGWILGKRHRNHFWQFQITEMDQVAYRFGPALIAFLKMDNGIKTHLEEKLAWKLYVKTTLESGTDGEKNILFALASSLYDEELIDKINPVKTLSGYFGENHPISKAVS